MLGWEESTQKSDVGIAGPGSVCVNREGAVWERWRLFWPCGLLEAVKVGSWRRC